jgi:hypothetical protein
MFVAYFFFRLEEWNDVSFLPIHWDCLGDFLFLPLQLAFSVSSWRYVS